MRIDDKDMIDALDRLLIAADASFTLVLRTFHAHNADNSAALGKIKACDLESAIAVARNLWPSVANLNVT